MTADGQQLYGWICTLHTLRESRYSISSAQYLQSYLCRRERDESVERFTDLGHSCVSTREGLESIRHTSAAWGRDRVSDGHNDSRRQLRGGERGESDRDGNHEGDEEIRRRERRGRSKSRERSAEQYMSARRRHSPPPVRERASARELHRVER